MLLKSFWLQAFWQSLTRQSARGGRSRRSRVAVGFRQQLETLETRRLLTTPAVVSISLDNASATNASSASWTATFSEPVTGVDPTDFSLIETGTIGATLTQISGSGSTYTLTVSGLTGNGTLGLNLVDNDSIRNSSYVSLGGPGAENGNLTGQVTTLDHVFPFVQSLNRTDPETSKTGSSSVIMTATFSEPVTGVDPTDFAIVGSASIGAFLTKVSAVSATDYAVTIKGFTQDGSLGLNLVDNGSIKDLAGNPLGSQNSRANFATTTTATGLLNSSESSNSIVDLNEDGNPDLVNLSGGTVSVLLGNGDGTFADPQMVSTGDWATSLAVSDVNGDGKPDLVTTNVSENHVSVLLGNGNGTFGAPRTIAVAPMTEPGSVVVGDVNGDGKPDIITTFYNPSYNGANPDGIGVLPGNGDGTFTTQQTIELNDKNIYPGLLSLADFNEDGKPDLFVASYVDFRSTILLGNGDGTFGDQRTFLTGSFYNYSIAVGDVNGDGHVDIALAAGSAISPGLAYVNLLTGNGDGTFAPWESFYFDGDALSVALADVNGDSKLDIVAGVQQSIYGDAVDDSVTVLLGNGNGTFQSQQQFAGGPYAIAVGDLNRDLKPDVVAANGFGSNTSNVLMNKGTGDFTGQTSTVDFSDITAGTVNDGVKTDIAYQNSTTVMSSNWTGFSGEGILNYQWAIGRTPGGTDVRAFKSVGTVTKATLGGLKLVPGTTYYVSIIATDETGKASKVVSSDGVTVVTAPVVTTQPTSQSVVAQETASFTAEAISVSKGTIQWQSSTDGATWENIADATATTYSLKTSLADNGTQYRAVFVNGQGTTTSAAATLTVKAISTAATIGSSTVSYGKQGLVTVKITTPQGLAPTGTVSLTVNGGTPRYSVLAANGSASFTLNLPDAGEYLLQASFDAHGDYSASTAKGTLRVTKSSSFTTTLGTGPYTYNAGVQAGGSGTVTGVGGLNAAATSLTYSANADGTGTADLTNAGTYYVTAHYAGDANHTPSVGQPVAITIIPAALSITAISFKKVYDGTAIAGGIPTVSGLQGRDTIAELTQAYDSKNVLGIAASTMVVTGYTLSDGNAGQNYEVMTVTAPGTITAKTLLIEAVSTTKVYDGTASSSSKQKPTVSGLMENDTISNLTQSYTSKNAKGAGKSILVVDAGYVLEDGNDGANYLVRKISVLGTIIPAKLTISATINTKVYDATTNASALPIASKLFGTDTLKATESYASKDVLGQKGSILRVNPNYTLSDGNGGKNYLVSLASVAGTITPAALTISASTATKIYDGTTDTIVLPKIIGLKGQDTVANLSQSYLLKDVLGTGQSSLFVNSSFVVNDGNGGKDYLVTLVTAAGTIKPAILTMSAATDSKVYDGTTFSTAIPTVAGLFGTDTVTGMTESYVSKNVLGEGKSVLVANQGYTIDDDNGGKNYAVRKVSAFGTITPVIATIAATLNTDITDAAF